MTNQFLGFLVLTGILDLGAATLASAADPMPAPSKDPRGAPAAQPIKGELLRIEGEFYVVKDAAGKEVRLQVSKETLLDARVKIGEKIDAQVLPDGRVITMFKALQ